MPKHINLLRVPSNGGLRGQINDIKQARILLVLVVAVSISLQIALLEFDFVGGTSSLAVRSQLGLDLKALIVGCGCGCPGDDAHGPVFAIVVVVAVHGFLHGKLDRRVAPIVVARTSTGGTLLSRNETARNKAADKGNDANGNAHNPVRGSDGKAALGVRGGIGVDFLFQAGWIVRNETARGVGGSLEGGLTR